MIEQLKSRPVTAVKGFTDSFTDDRGTGEVIGTLSPEGTLRRGIDTENVIGIDNGALRVQPLIQPGWARAGVAYGPYLRQNGLALAVFMLNGHNTAQSENLGDTLWQRLGRWWKGSETYSRRRRIIQWLLSKRKKRMIRQVQWWSHVNANSPPVSQVNENLAVGWFPHVVPQDPLREGNAFIMHATGPENGELWARVGADVLRTVRGVQNLQIYYVVLLREKGAAYYVASVAGANGLGTYPEMRPLAIDAFTEDSPVYPGLFQSTLGQIGFRLDTRVYGVKVQQIPELVDWYGTAHAADSLRGSGTLRRSHAEAGGIWRVCVGDYERSADGITAVRDENLALLDPGAPSGLIHVICETSSEGQAVAGLVWRYQDQDNFWKLAIGHNGCHLGIKVNGVWTEVACSDKFQLSPATTHALQLLDDGETMSFYRQGDLLFHSWIRDTRLQNAGGVGIYTSDAARGDVRFHSFEAHPRAVPAPDKLYLGDPWMRKGTKQIVADDFHGPAGDLAGRTTSMGGRVWHKQIGVGVMELTGDGAAKVRASTKCPNPGRTGYTIDWPNPEFADIEVNITPPGTERGQREHGLSGFILWQDPENYITVNIWLKDTYGGASISTFFHLDGYEDLYDAIWSNVGKRIYFGVPMNMRMVFDGVRYTMFINEEPVLYRALTDVYPDRGRFSVNHAGLLANWEWGNDTGSIFRNFVGRV